MRLRIFFGITILLALGGCAFGTKMSIESTTLSAPDIGSHSLQIIVADERPEVLSGEKTPEWIGFQRSGFGIPYGVHTTSGRPLAEELGKSLVSSFSKGGASPSLTCAPLHENPNNLQGSTDRALIVRIKAWKSDTMNNVHFKYNLEASVHDGKRRLLASNVAQADERLDGSIWNPVGASERAVTAKQKEVLERLLGSDQMRAALR